MAAQILNQEGKHRTFKGLEFWAENGLIFIEDRIDGDFKVITCRDFALRARSINDECKREFYASDRKELQDCVLAMYECWKEAKNQGDPEDIEVARRKYRERRKAVLITGMYD